MMSKYFSFCVSISKVRQLLSIIYSGCYHYELFLISFLFLFLNPLSPGVEGTSWNFNFVVPEEAMNIMGLYCARTESWHTSSVDPEPYSEQTDILSNLYKSGATFRAYILLKIKYFYKPIFHYLIFMFVLIPPRFCQK